MLTFAIATVYEGAFTSMYSNGGAFMTFLFIFNLYIFMLVYLHWPVEDGEQREDKGEIQMQENFSPIEQADIVLDEKPKAN